MLTLSQVRKTYHARTVLDGVDLRVAAGEVCCLVGLNGSGKSTLLAMACGLVQPDAGSVAVGGGGGAPPRGPVRRGIGYAPQEVGLYQTRTAFQNMLTFAGLYGLHPDLARERIAEAADQFAVNDVLHQVVGELSGGQQRRVHVVCAVLHQPSLLLLDEPTVGLDASGRALMLAGIRQAAARGAAVCYTTHHLAEIEALDATVALLDAGRVAYRGTAREVVERYADPYLVVEFTSLPDLDLAAWPWRTTVVGRSIRLDDQDAATILPAVIARLDEPALRTIVRTEVVSPSLEDLIGTITSEPPSTAA